MMMRSRVVHGLNPLVSWRRFVCGVLVVLTFNMGRADYMHHNVSGISYRSFQGLTHVLEVNCSGQGVLAASADVLALSMFHPNNNSIIASANLKAKDCTTSAAFSLCVIDDKGQGSRVTTLILDLPHNHTRRLGCNVTTTNNGVTRVHHWEKVIGHDRISVSTIAMLTSTTSRIQPGDVSTPPTGQSRASAADSYDIHPGLLITALLFLIFFIILAVVLLIMQIKERRRRHYLAEEYDTPLPIKSEYAVPGNVPRGVGEKERILAAGGRSPRPSTSSPIPHHVRKGSGTGSGGGGSIRYQQTGAAAAAVFHDEVPGYVAGHSISVYYAEPWSGVESEKEARVRPLSRAPPPHHYVQELKGGAKTATPSHYRQVAHELRGLKGTPTHFAELEGRGGGRGTPTHYAHLPHRQHTPQSSLEELKGLRSSPAHSVMLPPHDVKPAPVTSSAPPADHED